MRGRTATAHVEREIERVTTLRERHRLLRNASVFGEATFGLSIRLMTRALVLAESAIAAGDNRKIRLAYDALCGCRDD